jgi:hypothetical protein
MTAGFLNPTDFDVRPDIVTVEPGTHLVLQVAWCTVYEHKLSGLTVQIGSPPRPRWAPLISIPRH